MRFVVDCDTLGGGDCGGSRTFTVGDEKDVDVR